MLLRFIAADGTEQDVADIDGLYERIRAGTIGYESLVRDDATGRWVRAADHPLFKRIREIAGQQPSVAAPRPSVAPNAVPAWTPPPVVEAAPPVKAKSKWFAAIATRDEAVKIIRETAHAFFVLAAIQTAAGLFLMSNSNADSVGPEMLIDVPIYIGLAAWLKWGRSRTAAVLLLIVASIGATTTVLGRLGVMDGGRNIVLAVIVMWTAIKAVEATFKLRGRFKDEAVSAGRVEPAM